ncbi:MAG: hypothetical protein Q9226_007389 [Calogaya cf. arnoldii]
MRAKRKHDDGAEHLERHMRQVYINGDAGEGPSDDGFLVPNSFDHNNKNSDGYVPPGSSDDSSDGYIPRESSDKGPDVSDDMGDDLGDDLSLEEVNNEVDEQIDEEVNDGADDSGDNGGVPQKKRTVHKTVYTEIQDYPREKPIYIGEHPDGSLQFAVDITARNTKDPITTNHLLQERYIVSLAMTEACCKIRQGKVYWYPNYDAIPRINAKHKEPIRTMNSTLFHRLPKLVYIPIKWGEEDAKSWLSMSHEDRLIMLNARGGTIPRVTNLMPIDLVWEDEEKTEVWLNAYNETTPNRATLAIVPKAYLGWHGDLSEGNEGRVYAKKGVTDGAGAFTVANNTTLEQYRVEGADAIVQGLLKMYYEGKPKSLCSLQYLIDGSIGLHHRLHIEGKGKSAYNLRRLEKGI